MGTDAGAREATRLALIERVCAGDAEAVRAAYLLAEEFNTEDFDSFVRSCFPQGRVKPTAFDALADGFELFKVGAAIEATPTLTTGST